MVVTLGDSEAVSCRLDEEIMSHIEIDESGLRGPVMIFTFSVGVRGWMTRKRSIYICFENELREVVFC